MNVLFSTIVKIAGMVLLFFMVYYTSVVSDDNHVYYHVLHFPSLYLVVVGTVGLAFATSNYRDVLFLIFDSIRQPPSEIKRGINYVKKNLADITDCYYEKGAEGVRAKVDMRRMPPKWGQILVQLESKVSPEEVLFLLKRYAGGVLSGIDDQIKLVRLLKSSAPSLGMFGTILGLVKLLDDLSDFDSIGPNMSLALLTTLYGILVSIFFDPVVSHLEEKRANYLKSVEQSAFWLQAIAEKKPAFFMNQEFNKRSGG